MSWKLLSEEKPPLNQKVLVTTKNEIVKIDMLKESERSYGDKNLKWEYGSKKLDNVIAWQPLPKPYNYAKVSISYLKENAHKTVKEILDELEIDDETN